jgi:hypothetical protein
MCMGRIMQQRSTFAMKCSLLFVSCFCLVLYVININEILESDYSGRSKIQYVNFSVQGHQKQNVDNQDLPLHSSGQMTTTMLLMPSPVKYMEVNSTNAIFTTRTGVDLSQSNNNHKINRSILFCHVGKAGGESIKEELEFGCRSIGMNSKENSAASTYPQQTFSLGARLSIQIIRYKPSRLLGKSHYLFSGFTTPSSPNNLAVWVHQSIPL